VVILAKYLFSLVKSRGSSTFFRLNRLHTLSSFAIKLNFQPAIVQLDVNKKRQTLEERSGRISETVSRAEIFIVGVYTYIHTCVYKSLNE